MQSDEIAGDSQESTGNPLPSVPTQPSPDQPCPHGKDYDHCGACVSAVVMRRFVLDRQQDITGISGTGIILYGVEWYPGGPVDVYWKGTKTTGQYPSMAVVESTHCYNGNARVIYLDGQGSGDVTEAVLAIAEGISTEILGTKPLANVRATVVDKEGNFYYADDGSFAGKKEQNNI